MADYPTLPTSYGSDPVPVRESRLADRSDDGTLRVRSFGADKHTVSIEHPWLTTAQKSTLDTFYSTNRLLEFTYTSPTDASVKTCVFLDAPKYKREYGDYWTARVEVGEV